LICDIAEQTKKLRRAEQQQHTGVPAPARSETSIATAAGPQADLAAAANAAAAAATTEGARPTIATVLSMATRPNILVGLLRLT